MGLGWVKAGEALLNRFFFWQLLNDRLRAESADPCTRRRLVWVDHQAPQETG